MSGWEEAGAKKKKQSGNQQQKKKDMPKLQRKAPIEGTKTMFDIFNDVDAEKRKKKEAAEKKAAKAAKKEKYTGAFDGEELSDPRTNFEKSMKAKMDKKKKQSAAKKKAAAEPSGAGGAAAAKSELSIAQVVISWDTPALLAKLNEIDDQYDEDTQEHVMVLMIAEYLEEKFAGCGADWAELLGELDGAYGLAAEAVEQPVKQLPNKSCEAIVKKLRQRSAAARVGLVAFLLSHTWQTLSGKKAGGVGVRMLLQLVAKADAGAIAQNLRMLPIAGMEKLRGPEVDPNAPATKQGKHPVIKPEDAQHPLSGATTVWVLRQLGENSFNARTSVFNGWCSYLLPLLSSKSKPSAALALAASTEIFSNASWEKLSLRPDERKPEKGAGSADWMITPASLKALLCLRLPNDGAAPFRRAVLEQVCAKHGHAAGLFGPALFAQLLPLLGDGGAANLAEGARPAVVTLLLECLCAGGKTWANWVQTHTSSKALNFGASVSLLQELARSNHAVRSRMDRGKIIATIAEIRHFHQRGLEPEGGAGGKFPAEQLRSGLAACEAIDADPTGACKNLSLPCRCALEIPLWRFRSGDSALEIPLWRFRSGVWTLLASAEACVSACAPRAGNDRPAGFERLRWGKRHF